MDIRSRLLTGGYGTEVPSYVNIEDGAKVNLYRGGAGLGYTASTGRAPAEMNLTNNAEFYFRAGGSFDIYETATVNMDATSRLKSNGSINLLGTLVIDASAAAEWAGGTEKKLIDQNSTTLEGSANVKIEELPAGVVVIYGEDGDISLRKLPAYTVTWVNYDGTVLETDSGVIEGTEVSYEGADPVKPDSDTETFTFAGWDSTETVITGDTVFTATFVASPRPLAFLNDAAYSDFYTASRKANNGAVIKLNNTAAMPIETLASINNAEVTMTGTGYFAWKYTETVKDDGSVSTSSQKFRIGSPSEAKWTLHNDPIQNATLVIKDANLYNLSDGAHATGFEIYNRKGHKEKGTDNIPNPDTYYPGTLKIVDSYVDVNDIWCSGNVEISGEETQVIARFRFMMGTEADVTANVSVTDGATVELRRDAAQDVGAAGPAVLMLTDGATFWYNPQSASKGYYDIHEKGTLKIDATSQLKSEGGINHKGTIILDAAGLAAGESHTYIDSAYVGLTVDETRIQIVNGGEDVVLTIAEDGDIILTRAAAE